MLYHRRESGVLGLSKCWLGGFEGSSHTPRKATAVSLSSISSAAVASIFVREKLLMSRPSTIFQLLPWGNGIFLKSYAFWNTRANNVVYCYFITWFQNKHLAVTGGNKRLDQSHLNMDREWVDEVIWDSIRVASWVNTHGDKVSLKRNRRNWLKLDFKYNVTYSRYSEIEVTKLPFTFFQLKEHQKYKRGLYLISEPQTLEARYIKVCRLVTNVSCMSTNAYICKYTLFVGVQIPKTLHLQL